MPTINHINIQTCSKVPCTNTTAMHLHNLQLHNLYICHSPLCFKKPCMNIHIFHFTFTSVNIPLRHSFTHQFFLESDTNKSFFTTSCTFRTSTSTSTVLSNMLTPSFDALSISTHLRFISATLDSSSKKEHTTTHSSLLRTSSIQLLISSKHFQRRHSSPPCSTQSHSHSTIVQTSLHTTHLRLLNPMHHLLYFAPYLLRHHETLHTNSVHAAS